MIKKAIATASVLLLCIGVTFAGTNPDVQKTQIDANVATITGSVTDATTGEAVSGATVELTEAGLSTTTDEYGTFTFDDAEAGSHTVTITADGYTTAEQSVEVTEEGANVEIQLEPEM